MRLINLTVTVAQEWNGLPEGACCDLTENAPVASGHPPSRHVVEELVLAVGSQRCLPAPGYGPYEMTLLLH